MSHNTRSWREGLRKTFQLSVGADLILLLKRSFHFSHCKLHGSIRTDFNSNDMIISHFCWSFHVEGVKFLSRPSLFEICLLVWSLISPEINERQLGRWTKGLSFC